MASFFLPLCPRRPRRPQTATNRACEVHDASRLLESQGQILPLSDGMLHQLCKSGARGRRRGIFILNTWYIVMCFFFSFDDGNDLCCVVTPRSGCASSAGRSRAP